MKSILKKGSESWMRFNELVAVCNSKDVLYRKYYVLVKVTICNACAPFHFARLPSITYLCIRVGIFRNNRACLFLHLRETVAMHSGAGNYRLQDQNKMPQERTPAAQMIMFTNNYLNIALNNIHGSTLLKSKSKPYFSCRSAWLFKLIIR